MKETYTSTEARAALHVDAKTFLRWLKQGDIKPQVSKADQRIKLFTQEQVQRLADEHERSLRDEGTLSTDERLAALESRVQVLEQQLAQMSNNTPTARKQPQRPIPSPNEVSASNILPDGLTPLNELMKQHGLERQRKAIISYLEKQGKLKRGDWTLSGHAVNLALDEQGVEEFERRYVRE